LNPAGRGDAVPNRPVKGAIKDELGCCEEGGAPLSPPGEKKKKSSRCINKYNHYRLEFLNKKLSKLGIFGCNTSRHVYN
jgi:hypothetical protein